MEIPISSVSSSDQSIWGTSPSIPAHSFAPLGHYVVHPPWQCQTPLASTHLSARCFPGYYQSKVEQGLFFLTYTTFVRTQTLQYLGVECHRGKDANFTEQIPLMRGLVLYSLDSVKRPQPRPPGRRFPTPVQYAQNCSTNQNTSSPLREVLAKCLGCGDIRRMGRSGTVP